MIRSPSRKTKIDSRKGFAGVLLSFICGFLCVVFAAGLTSRVAVETFADGTIPVTTGSISHSFSYSNSGGTWSYSSSKLTGKVSRGGDDCDGYTNVDSTCTITNPGDVIQLSFKCDKKYKLDGTEVAANATASKILTTGSSFTITISSGTDESSRTYTFSSFAVSNPPMANLIFLPSIGGSYTVDGSTVEAEMSKTVLAGGTVSLVASPSYGYSFLCWQNADNWQPIANNPNYTLTASESVKIEPVFIQDSTDNNFFKVGNTSYNTLREANVAAFLGNDKLIVTAKNATLAESAAVSYGVTLLVPNSDDNTVFRDSPTVSFTKKFEDEPPQSLFRSLTISSSAEVQVYGEISVMSKIYAVGQSNGYNGVPYGPYGNIVVQSGGAIKIKSGGVLYAWGYVSGEGTVEAESGGSVYECFQVRDYRGGTNTSSLQDNPQKVFHFSQYYIQNIECKLVLKYGSSEYVTAAVNIATLSYVCPTHGAKLIGPTSDYLFQVKSQSGSLTKQYDTETDRLSLEVDGDFSFNKIVITMAITVFISSQTITIDSSDYVLPINSNIDIKINSGNSTIASDILLQPGVSIEIAKGASVTIASGKTLYLYAAADWQYGFIFNCGSGSYKDVHVWPVAYSTSKGTGVQSIRKTAALKNAKLIINGTLNVNGNLCTTKTDSDIVTSGTGKIIFAESSAFSGERTTYQSTAGAADEAMISVNVVSATLKNADGSLTTTAGSTASAACTYVWCTHRTGTTANDSKIGIWDKQSTKGWNDEKTQYYLSTCGDYATGLYHCPTSGNPSDLEIHDFDASGVFQSTVNGPIPYNGSKYFVLSGIVQTHGLYRYNNRYYPVDQSNHLLSDGLHYLSYPNNDLGLLDGYYTITKDGYIQQIDETDNTPHIVTFNDVKYYARNGIAYPVGLFPDSGRYYYAKSDGSLAVDQTYYASKTNGLYAEGNYYFDSEGHLYSASFTEVTAS